MDILMQEVSEAFKQYRIIMFMDRASWHIGNKTKKWENIIPLFQLPYLPELNPVESIWHLIREDGDLKNKTFKTLNEAEIKLEEYLKNLNPNTIKSTTLFNPNCPFKH